MASASRAYRTLLHRAAGLPRLEVHYLTFGEGAAMPPHWCAESLALVERERKRAYGRTNAQLGVRMTQAGGTRLRIAPPLLTAVTSRTRDAVMASLDPYLETVSPDIQELLKDYGVLDVAHKVVGVGSVGTRDYVVLLQGNHVGDELFLQVKEALPSVVRDPALPHHRHHGRQVVDGQRRIQSVSDPFLGWTSVGSRPYFVRQLRDMKAGADPKLLLGPDPPRLRRALRGHPRQGPRPDGLPDDHRHLLREQRALRRGDGGLRPGLRRPGGAGPRRARQRGEGRRRCRPSSASERSTAGAGRDDSALGPGRSGRPARVQDWVTRGAAGAPARQRCSRAQGW